MSNTPFALRAAAVTLLICCSQLNFGIASGLIATRDIRLPQMNAGSEASASRPLSLASADFDGDGIADLVVGLSQGQNGAIALYKGNIDAIFPYSPEARARRTQGAFSDAPFLSSPYHVALPIQPDFVITGDLDNDGFWDVAAAARGSAEIEWLRGRGNGELTPAGTISLPGQITAMVSGEVNRRDGLEDIVIAVVTDDGAKLLVFESPLGALRGAPEIHNLPAPVTDISLGFLGSWMRSIIAIAGEDIVIVRGRDRRLSLDIKRRRAVGAAQISTIRLPQAAIAVTTRWSTEADSEDIVILLDDGRVAAIAGNTLSHSLENEPVGPISSDIVDVFTSSRNTVGSHARLITAQCAGGSTQDLFMIDPESGDISSLKTSLSTMTVERSTVISGDFAPTALVMRLGPPALQSLLIPRIDIVQTLTEIYAPADSTFVVNDNNDDSDSVLNGVCETESGNGICTLRAALEEANSGLGPQVISFEGMLVGDHTIFPLSALPVIQRTITINGWTHPDGLVEIDGSAANPASGLTLNAGNSALRGLAIHSFLEDGVRFTDGGFNVVEACNIGNCSAGLSLSSSSRNQIGGANQYARNVLSWNGTGLAIENGALNIVQGNHIGTNYSGTLRVSNSTGIRITSSDANTIGGASQGDGNLVSANTRGIYIQEADGTQILGNLVGTDVTGTVDLGNGYGIDMDQDANASVGSTAILAGNVISGNGYGIRIDGSDPIPEAGNLIQNNLIGTDITGTIAVGNVYGPGGAGVLLGDWTSDVVIGGSVTGTANVISGNFYGVHFDSSNGNAVLGNLIGTDITSESPLPNTRAGILISNSSASAIGGTGSGDGNVIAFNARDGVTVKDGGIFNAIQGNTFILNGDLAIDIDDDGITANDPGDGDSGTNRLMNFPEISNSRITETGDLEVTYTVSCDPSNADYDLRVEFYSADSNLLSTSLDYLGFENWSTTDYAAGSKTIIIGNAAGLGVSEGQWIVATTTDEDGNTSEFGHSSWIFEVMFADGFESGDTSAWDSTTP